jgi:hypothetical protein
VQWEVLYDLLLKCIHIPSGDLFWEVVLGLHEVSDRKEGLYMKWHHWQEYAGAGRWRAIFCLRLMGAHSITLSGGARETSPVTSPSQLREPYDKRKLTNEGETANTSPKLKYSITWAYSQKTSLSRMHKYVGTGTYTYTYTDRNPKYNSNFPANCQISRSHVLPTHTS